LKERDRVWSYNLRTVFIPGIQQHLNHPKIDINNPDGEEFSEESAE